MNYAQHVGHLFLAGIIGLVALAVKRLESIDDKMSSIMIVQSQFSLKMEFLDTRLAKVERQCTEKKRL